MSLLLGAVLAPTDPVFAAALVGNEKVPGRLRHLLSVESGVNDGLALPFVIVLIAVAIGLLVFALSTAKHANLFLAAFAAGVAVATSGPRQRESSEEFGELVAELLELAALLVFGALITPGLFADVGIGGWAFAVLALLLARPVALLIAFLGARLSLREQAAAMWFGPKGFASVVYGLLVLQAGISHGEQVADLVAVTIVLSILAHSSSDVLVARWFDEAHEVPTWVERGSRALRRRASWPR